MAYPVTLGTLRTRIRERAHLENSTFVTDAELNRLINVHRRRLHLRLARNVPAYFATDTTLTTVAGTIAYALPADFMSLQVAYLVDGTRYRPLRPMTDVQRVVYQAPGAVYSISVRYTPVPADLASDSDTVDGIICYDEWIVCACARSIRTKEETDLIGISAELNDLENDILSGMSMRDAGAPTYVTEVEYYDAYPYLASTTIDAYQLRGSGASTTYMDLYSLTPSAYA